MARKRKSLKGTYRTKKAANRRRYSKVSQGSPIVHAVPRGCAIVQSGAKKGKMRKGCRIKNGRAYCDVVTRLPAEAKQRKKNGKYKTVNCPS